MAACLAIALAELEIDETKKIALHAVCLLAIGVAGVLLVVERFGG
jgi:hypothetical protein